MAKIGIVTDSTSDIPPMLREEWDIHIVNAFVHFGTESYASGELSLSEFYEKMENSTKENFPTTSQPKANDLLEIYEKLKQQGHKEIISIHVSQSLSGTLNSANVAKGMIDGVDIRIVDSLGATANLMAVVKKARELVDKGLSLDEVEQKTIEFADSLVSYMTLKSIDNLVRGGRISKIKYRFGRLFNIKPILRLKQGKLAPYKKARGITRARDKMFDEAMKLVEDRKTIQYIIGHTLQEEAALDIEKRLLEKFPKSKGYVIDIGMVIAVHGDKGAILLLVY